MPSVLLIDDHHIIVSAVAVQIADYWPTCEIQTASTLSEGFSALKSRQFNVAIVDLTLPDSNGPQCLGQLRRAHPNLGLIVFTGFIQPYLEQACLAAGADYFVSKGEHRDSLIKVLSKRLGAPPKTDDKLGKELTLRQRQVLKLLLAGSSVKDVAMELNVAESTIQTHVTAINQAGNCRNRMELAIWAKKMGFA